jgi:uncharacterized protein (TIGR02145 family)
MGDAVMSFFNFTKLGQTLSLTAVLAVGSVWLVGCGVVDPGTVVKGTFTDERDDKTYKTVKIGRQTWMAENLNTETAESWCYEHSAGNCAKYGRLYTWAAAMKACPSGWHLPSRREWGDLARAVGSYGTYGTLGNAGEKLKSKSGWNWNTEDNVSGNGTDKYGFSALPGGDAYPIGGDCCRDCFFDIGDWGFWWTSADRWNDINGGYAYLRSMDIWYDLLAEGDDIKSSAHSVRCIEN